MTNSSNVCFHSTDLNSDFSFRGVGGTGWLDGIGGLTGAGKKVLGPAGYRISLFVPTAHERQSPPTVVLLTNVPYATQDWMPMGQALAECGGMFAYGSMIVKPEKSRVN